MFKIGEMIKQARKEKNLTQAELGKLLGISNSAVQKYEKGVVTNIPYTTLLRLQSILDLPIILFENSENSIQANSIINSYLSSLRSNSRLPFIVTKNYILIDLWHYKNNPNSTGYLEFFLRLALHLNDEQFRQIKSYCQFITHQPPTPPEQSE